VSKRGRNADIVEYTLVSSSGEQIMKAARYYGFRNIQNLVRKLKPARISRLPGAKSASNLPSRQLPNSRPADGTIRSSVDHSYVEVMACPGGCTNGGGQIRVGDIKSDTVNMQGTPSDEVLGQSQKQSSHEQRAWLSRVDEAYFSAESEPETEPEIPFTNMPVSHHDDEVCEVLDYWSSLIGIPLPKLVYTTYCKVESDVGKDKGVGDTARVIEIAGKIGGGW
jgi:iron only hydrogenase large subunit-like protein